MNTQGEYAIPRVSGQMRQSQDRPEAAGGGVPKFGFGSSDPYALSEHGGKRRDNSVFNRKRFTEPAQKNLDGEDWQDSADRKGKESVSVERSQEPFKTHKSLVKDHVQVGVAQSSAQKGSNKD